jgi:hypothetical protein
MKNVHTCIPPENFPGNGYERKFMCFRTTYKYLESQPPFTSIFYNRRVRVLQSLLPPLLLVLYKVFLAPINNGQLAVMMLGES